MLSQYTPAATLPTADMSKARNFYEGTLGLTALRDETGGVLFACGDAGLFVYESQYAGTNKATAASFEVPISLFQGEVDALRAQGIEFVTFDAPDLDWDNGVASMGSSMRAVWFSDPDGNIINVVSSGES